MAGGSMKLTEKAQGAATIDSYVLVTQMELPSDYVITGNEEEGELDAMKIESVRRIPTSEIVELVQDNLEIDDEPTDESDALITSGSVKAELDRIDEALDSYNEDITNISGIEKIASFTSGGMYSATGIVYVDANRSHTDFVKVTPGDTVTFDFDITGQTNIFIYEFATDTETASGVNERLARTSITNGASVTFTANTNYIRIQVNIAYTSIVNPVKMARTTAQMNRGFLLDAGSCKIIPDGTDLNTLTTPGNYKIMAAANAATIVNAPMTKSAFALKVMTVTSSARLYQLFFLNATDRPYVFVRNRATDTVWSTWRLIVDADYVDDQISVFSKFNAYDILDKNSSRLSYPNQTRNGIAWAWNASTKEYSVSGTATANSVLTMFPPASGMLDGIEAGGTYYLYCETTDSNVKVNITAYSEYTEGGSSTIISTLLFNKDSEFTIPEGTVAMRFGLMVENGKTVDGTIGGFQILNVPKSSDVQGAVETQISDIYTKFSAVSDADMTPPEWEYGGLYTADGTEYDGANRLRTPAIDATDISYAVIGVTQEGYTLRIFEYYADDTLRAHYPVSSGTEYYPISPDTAYIRLLIRNTDGTRLSPSESSVAVFATMREDPQRAEALKPDNIVNCTWMKGSAYTETGIYYYDGSRVLSSYIHVEKGNIFKWVSDTGWTVRIYFYQLVDGKLSYTGYEQSTGNGSILIDDADYIRINLTRSGVNISIKDACELYKFQLFTGSALEKDNQTAERQLGIIPVIWQSGGIYNASGEEYVSTTRIRTPLIEKPESGIVYVTVPQGYMVRMYIYRTVNSEIEYINSTMGTQDENYTTNFALEFPSDVTHFRLLAKVNEETEVTKMDSVIDGRKIAVYTDTQLVNYSINDEVRGYVIKEADAVSDKFNALTDSDLSFIAVSDLHYWHNNPVCKASINDMSNAVEIISDQCDLDYLMSFGDYIYRWKNQYDYTDGKAEMIECRKLLDRCFNHANLPQIRLVGNHDPNSLDLGKYYTMNDLWKHIGQYTDNLVVDSQNPKGSYGYVDLAAKKIRIICLNTSDFTDEGHPPQEPYESYPDVNSVSTYLISVRQVEWFAESLKNTPDDYKILIISHVPIDVTSGSLYGRITCNLWNVVSAYQNSASGSISVKESSVSYDFTSVTTPCEILPYIHGHIHSYTTSQVNISSEADVTTRGSILRVAVPNALPYRDSAQPKVSMTKDSTAFCVMALDTTHGILTALHYGAGEDRIMHYKPLTVSASTTLVTSLTAVDWVSVDTTKVTVPNDDGVLVPVASGNTLVYAIDADGNKEYWNIKVSL